MAAPASVIGEAVDVVVIGAGHNGMAAVAISHARARRSSSSSGSTKWAA
ncbi:hypothetical protein ACFSLT_31230 [Novosphingobium resinovorum]